MWHMYFAINYYSTCCVCIVIIIIVHYLTYLYDHVLVVMLCPLLSST